jgi:hypothetical protein
LIVAIDCSVVVSCRFGGSFHAGLHSPLVLRLSRNATCPRHLPCLCSYLSRIDRVQMSRMRRHDRRTPSPSQHWVLRPRWHGGQLVNVWMTRSLCAHCQRCAFSTPAQQWERQHHVRNTVRPRPPLHRSGRALLRSRLVASHDNRTRPVGKNAPLNKIN